MRMPSDDMRLRADFQMHLGGEKKPGAGEDAYIYSLNRKAALAGVFDGCGGSGAKRYEALQNRSGAYLASRIVSGSVRNWFLDCCAEDLAFDSEGAVRQIRRDLSRCREASAENSRLISSLVRTFPTTAAFAVCTPHQREILADCFWAGDSRIYLLDGKGLAQLSRDDLKVSDAMQNLYADDQLTNVISCSGDFTLHHRQLRLKGPCILLTVTDGCFGYLQSPMDFEKLLLDTFLESDSVADWEQNLTEAIGCVAGDDFSLSALALDFGSWKALKKVLADRAAKWYRSYTPEWSAAGREEKTLFWQRTYAKQYYRLEEESRTTEYKEES